MFTDLEWKRLADATGISFRYHSPRRHAWDFKWKAEFENILKDEVISDVVALSTRVLTVQKLCHNEVVELLMNISD
jgi:hypothetical protein